MKAITKLQQICDKIKFFFRIAATFCMVILIIATTWGVFTRYFLNNPQGWTEEISLLMLVWFALFAATVATFGKKHVYADFLYNKFPEKGKLIIRSVSAGLAIIFLVAFVFSTHKVLPAVREYTSVLNISRKLYYYPVYVCIPFMVFAYVVELVSYMITGKIVADENMARN